MTTTNKQPTTTTTTRSLLEELEVSDEMAQMLARMEAQKSDPRAMTADERAGYVATLCKALHLNPLTRPAQFINLSGREVLYLTRTATDQLAAMHNLNRKTIDGPRVVDVCGTKVGLCTVEVSLPSGRSETATATLPAADFVNLYMKLECVPLDSEILTRRGFKHHDEVKIGEDVLAYDITSDVCEWVPLDNVSVFPSAPVSTFSTKGGGFSFRCTPNHSWAIDTMGRAGRALVEAQHVKTQHRLRIAAPTLGGDHPLTPELAAVIGWVMCDGTIKRVGNYVSLAISQSKPQRVAEIRELLTRAGLHAQEGVGEATTRTFPSGSTYDCLPQHWFRLNADESRATLATAGIESPADLPRLVTRLSQPARRAMLDAMLAADGTGGHTFGKKRKPGVMEAWQILCTLEGIALGKLGTSTVGDVPVQRMLTYDYVAGNNVALTPDGETPVWCPTTKHGTWIMRQNGRISITGNTKAKRRGTLSILGLGVLGEDEIETIPDAKPSTLNATPAQEPTQRRANPMDGLGIEAPPKRPQNAEETPAQPIDAAPIAEAPAWRVALDALQESAPDLATYCNAVEALTLPGDAAPVWRKHRDTIGALSKQTKAAAWGVIVARVESLGQKGAATWLTKGVKMLDAAQTDAPAATEAT